LQFPNVMFVCCDCRVDIGVSSGLQEPKVWKRFKWHGKATRLTLAELSRETRLFELPRERLCVPELFCIKEGSLVVCVHRNPRISLCFILAFN
jgi:hypothetical protein